MASLWDEGDIAQAVTKAKKIGAVFIVFVEGKDDLSAHYAKLFSDKEVLGKLKTTEFVAIKVQENSTAHQQFSAIYPHSSIPSIFFIGKNGRPLEILSESIEVDAFNTKISTILEHNGETTQQGLASKNLIDNEQVLESSTNINVPTTSNEAQSSSIPQQISAGPSSTLPPETKIQHAKELIEQKREEKRKQEEEAERLKEIERRKMGQNVQQMKKWQQDEELKQLKEDRDREKRENQAARDRVLAQIAQDKAERAAKFSKQPSASAPQISQPSRSVPRTNTTRIQFRLPDGSQHTHEFQISDSLETVHQYIQHDISLPFTTYTLSTTFPRREFTFNDNSQTLLDLQLVPNAVVLILPQNQGSVSASTSGVVGNVFWWLLAPLLNIYDFLVGYLFGRPPTTRSVESSSTKRSSSEVEESNRKTPKRQSSDSTVIKRQGNIHRLQDRPDADDDNNTWNGNSTQQM